MHIDWIGKSFELKLHCFCLFDAYSMPKDMCSVKTPPKTLKKTQNVSKTDSKQTKTDPKQTQNRPKNRPKTDHKTYPEQTQNRHRKYLSVWNILQPLAFKDSLDSNHSGTGMYVNASSLAASAAQPPNGNDELTAGQTLLQSIGAGVVGAASSFSTITPPRYRKSFLRPYQHF